MSAEPRREPGDSDPSGTPSDAVPLEVNAPVAPSLSPGQAVGSAPPAGAETRRGHRARWAAIGASAAVVVLIAGGGAAAWARSHRFGGYAMAGRTPRAGAMVPGHLPGRAWGGWRDNRGVRPWQPGSNAPVPGRPSFGPGNPRFVPGAGAQSMPGPWGQPPAVGPANNAPSVSGNLSQAQLGKVATSLGMPQTDLDRELRAGKTLATIGQERGKTREEVRSAVIDAMVDAR